MWTTVIYTLVSVFVLYLSPLRITSFSACLFGHLGTYKLKGLLWEQSSLKIRVWFWVRVLTWLKVETMNAWGLGLVFGFGLLFFFSRSAIEQKRQDCSFADLLDVSYCFALFAACWSSLWKKHVVNSANFLSKIAHKAQLPFQGISDETKARGQLSLLAEADHRQLSWGPEGFCVPVRLDQMQQRSKGM